MTCEISKMPRKVCHCNVNSLTSEERLYLIAFDFLSAMIVHLSVILKDPSFELSVDCAVTISP